MIELSNILKQTIDTAKTAGAFIRQESKTFDRNKIESKGLNDLVSYVDKEAEKIIVSQLREILPEADFIAEEGTAGQSGKDYTWIIDPLDGTTNFIHGIPIFAVSIGLKYKDEIVLGVVYEVNFDECFYASKGNGAYLNEKKIQVSKPKTLSESLVVTGFPYSAFSKIDNYLKILRSLMETCHGLRRMGSAATDLCYVACGRSEGFFEYDLKPYDVAAGVIILQEAGGKVTDFEGDNDYLFGKTILASNSHVHTELMGKIQKVW
jgi:myo-inositol-1(or 4)-monophosphatase